MAYTGRTVSGPVATPILTGGTKPKTIARAFPTPPPIPDANLPLGTLQIVGGNPLVKITALMGDSPPTITGGYGGWTDVERPGRMSLTAWKGGAPLRLRLVVMLDGYAAGASVQSQVANLEKLARRPAGAAHPPLVRVGGAIPHPSTNWVIEGLEWGDVALRDAAGRLVRQAATVSLVQFVDDDLIVERAAEKARSKRTTAKRTRVHKNESVRDVAKRLKIDAKALAKANDIRDPRRKLQRDYLTLP
jgi:hypothetical protein